MRKLRRKKIEFPRLKAHDVILTLETLRWFLAIGFRRFTVDEVDV